MNSERRNDFETDRGKKTLKKDPLYPFPLTYPEENWRRRGDSGVDLDCRCPWAS